MMYKLYIISLIAFILFGIPIQNTNAKPIPITLIKISDGDTIKAIVDSKKESIRLLKIDCYETSKNRRAIWQSEYYHLSIGQVLKRGNYAKQQLQQLIGKGGKLSLDWSKRDKYKRILGTLYMDGISINDYMLESGLCEEYVPRLKP